jgi:MFS family permease
MLATSAMNAGVMDSTFNVFFKLNYAKLYDSILATRMGPRDIAIGEVTWSLLRGGAYAAAFLAVAALAGLVPSWWGVLALPAAVFVAFAFSAVGMFATAFLRAPAGVDVSRCSTAVTAWEFVRRMAAAWPVIAVISAGNALVMPSVSSLASKLAPPGQAGVVLGGQQSASSLARVLGPALAGLLYQRVGPGAPYVAAAGGMLLALALSLRVRAPSAA